MANYKVIVTARSFGNTDRKAYDLLEAAGCTVKKLVAADGPVEEQLRRRGPAPQQMAGDEADACRPRRVGGRRPHHDGTHDVEDVHGEGLLIKK